jgi:hypothetical protein
VSATDEHRRAVRRLCKNGNSITVSVPPEFMRAMNVLPGSQLELVFDREWEGFFVRVYHEPPIAPTPADLSRESGDDA